MFGHYNLKLSRVPPRCVWTLILSVRCRAWHILIFHCERMNFSVSHSYSNMI